MPICDYDLDSDQCPPRSPTLIGTAVIVEEGQNKKVFDNNGRHFFTVPNTWDEDQINRMVAIANRTYDRGFEAGLAAKAEQIRAVIGMK